MDTSDNPTTETKVDGLIYSEAKGGLIKESKVLSDIDKAHKEWLRKNRLKCAAFAKYHSLENCTDNRYRYPYPT